jgi:hypothetical protein
VIEHDLRADASDARGDLGHGDEGANADHFGPGEDEHGPALSSDRCEPGLSARLSPETSASAENTCGFSGLRS